MHSLLTYLNVMKRIFKSNHAFLYPSCSGTQLNWVLDPALCHHEKEGESNLDSMEYVIIVEWKPWMPVDNCDNARSGRFKLQKTFCWGYWFVKYFLSLTCYFSESMNFTLLNISWIYEIFKEDVISFEEYEKWENSEFVSSLFLSNRTEYAWFRTVDVV